MRRKGTKHFPRNSKFSYLQLSTVQLYIELGAEAAPNISFGSLHNSSPLKASDNACQTTKLKNHPLSFSAPPFIPKTSIELEIA